MKSRRLLGKLVQGSQANVTFEDFIHLVQAFGFRKIRVSGSHHFFERPGVQELLNLQPHRGEAKPYQIRQFLSIVEKYDLKLED
jgi:predicted RNA binding protein YcfA (HicA-like mRNA interferase family)